MKSRLSRSGVAVAIGVSVALAGCSAGGSMSEGTGGGGSASAAPVAWNEPTADLSGVTLTFGGGSVGGALDKVIKDFEAATKVKIKRTVYPDPYEQNLLTKVATGDKPDLASWQPTASSLAALQAPTNLLPLEGAPWLESLDPGLRDITGFFDKTRYAALVTTPSVMGVYYNKAAFTKAGVTELPKSWAELIAAADAIKAEGQVPFHEAGGAKWPTQWWVQVPLAEAAKAGLWEEVNTNEQQFTSPAIQAAITDYKGLIDKGYFNKDIKTATFEEQAEAVYSGKAAMSVQVDALLLQMQTTHSATEIDKAVGWFPISKDGNIATSIPDNKNGVVAFKTGDAKREAASKQFLNFWMTTNYESFIANAGTVSLKPDVPTPDSVPQVAKDIAASLSDSVGSMQSLAVANPDLYLNLANKIYGQQTPEQVAEQTQKQFAQLAKAQGATGF